MKPSASLLFVTILGIVQIPCYAQVQQSWVQRYTTSGNEVPVAIKTNGSSVYVLAATNQYQSTGDILLVKYNSAGTFQWAATYNGTGNAMDSPVAMTLDGAGNIYVVGKSGLLYNNGSTSETVTLKYSPSGTLLWAAKKLRPDMYPCEPDDVAVDASGNVYVAGSTIEGAPFAYDFMTIKYNSSGAEQWTRTYNGTANSVDMDTRLALDATGNIYVSGSSQGQARKGRIIIQTFADIYTIKYDPAGNIIWQRRFNSTYSKADVPNAIALDASGNVYITGESNNGSNNDYITLKYDVNGTLLYQNRFNGGGNLHDSAKGIVVNGAGEAYVTGLSDPYGNYAYDYVTIKYGATGTYIWAAGYNGPSNGTDIANAIGMDAFGNIYVTGESQSPLGYDFATIKYSSAGAQLWAARYNGPGNGTDQGAAIAVYTPSGPAFQNASIYVAGGSTGSGTGLDVATVKYTQPLIIGRAVVAATSGLSNYPNPFTGSTTIEFDLSYDSNVSLTVLDVMTGKEVETISMGALKAGKHSKVYDPVGLKKGNYVYKVIADGPEGRFTESKIMRIDH